MGSADNTKSNIFLRALILSVLVSLFLVYQKYIVKNDYFVRVELPCNPDVDVCFVSECDADADPRCSGDVTRNYKVILMKAYKVPPLDCVDSADCQTFLCSTETRETLEIEDSCSNE